MNSEVRLVRRIQTVPPGGSVTQKYKLDSYSQLRLGGMLVFADPKGPRRIMLEIQKRLDNCLTVQREILDEPVDVPVNLSTVRVRGLEVQSGEMRQWPNVEFDTIPDLRSGGTVSMEGFTIGALQNGTDNLELDLCNDSTNPLSVLIPNPTLDRFALDRFGPEHPLQPFKLAPNDSFDVYLPEGLCIILNILPENKPVAVIQRCGDLIEVEVVDKEVTQPQEGLHIPFAQLGFTLYWLMNTSGRLFVQIHKLDDSTLSVLSGDDKMACSEVLNSFARLQGFPSFGANDDLDWKKVRANLATIKQAVMIVGTRFLQKPLYLCLNEASEDGLLRKDDKGRPVIDFNPLQKDPQVMAQSILKGLGVYQAQQR